MPKSILKPTVPITPPKAIPSFEASRRKTPGTAQSKKSPAKKGSEDLLIDFSTPAPTASTGNAFGAQNLADPFSPLKDISEDKAQHDEPNVETEQESEERRKQEKKAILEQRAARRKSMANRRVSFAPEATLHTWNVIEMAEDSTTSSAANSTRRQSSMTADQSPKRNEPSSDPPSTPVTQIEEPLVEASPAHQRDLHQKKRRRRSSGIPPMNFNNPDDDCDFSSSPLSGSSAAGESSPIAVDDSINSDDDSDNDNDTAMSIDDMTAQSGVSMASSTGSLDERLATAANLAGTRGIEYDENGDEMSMELATGTVTNAFQPWAKKAENIAQDLTSMQDQENLNPFSPAFKAQTVANVRQASEEDDETQDMSMDVTAAVGGILPSKELSASKGRRKSVATSRRRSSVARRRSSGNESMLEDETMELTTMGGGILQSNARQVDGDESMVDDDEEMTMEFTNVVGGVLNRPQEQPQTESPQHDSIESSTMDETMAMDMTTALGGILDPIEEQTEPLTDNEETQAMDVTRAIGGILPRQMDSIAKTEARQLMEQEAESVYMNSSPLAERTAHVSPPKPKSAVPDRFSTSIASETGSPSLALKPRLSGRRSIGTRQSTAHTAAITGTPVKATPTKVGTPTKQKTPKPGRPETPEKTPILANVTYRSASPKKLFKEEIKAKNSPGSVQKPRRKSLFSQDAETGAHTPSVVLPPKPHQHLRRRSSGIGVDQDGMGSPRVSALLDRRTSIGEGAGSFVPDPFANRGVRFENPRAMEEEIDAEREEEHRRESGRYVMEQEADGHQDDENATMQLKDMIQAMTPKKNKLKGRKSLAVGAARGVLGKRPAELDMDDDADEHTPKRLKAIENQASPVKRIHLPAPPSKDETTGRMTRAKRKSLQETTGNTTPTASKSHGKATTPRNQGRFKDTPLEPDSARPTSFEDKLDNVMDAVDASVVQAQHDGEIAEEKIHLQDFLNMTNIHFMELNTTKRRHTMAPAASESALNEYPTSLADCVAASTTTLPLLELYQHACRELKSYISSGRKIIRSIEQETFEEQPPLFREYLDAKPDVKMVMDNQFRNGKVNARLQSKAGWYAWRSQLVDGLRAGLDGIRAGMTDDEAEIHGQQEMINSVLPSLEQSNTDLVQEEQYLLKRKDELDSEDHEALRDARTRLFKLQAELSTKTQQLQHLEEDIQNKDTMLADAAELQTEFHDQITEAERVQEECRGLSLKDVRTAREQVEDIEKRTGWQIVSAEEDEDYSEACGPAVTMLYKGELRLFFYPASLKQEFASSSRHKSGRSSRSSGSSFPSAPISLSYTPSDSNSTLENLPTEKRFILQNLRSQLQAFALRPSNASPEFPSPTTILSTVSQGWDLAQRLTEEIRLLKHMGITDVRIKGDEVLGVKVAIMIPSLPTGEKARVDISFDTTLTSTDLNLTTLDVDFKAIYGPHSLLALLEKKKEKVVEALRKEVGSSTSAAAMGEEAQSQSQSSGTEVVAAAAGKWRQAVKGLEEWCLGNLEKEREKEKGKGKEKEKEKSGMTPGRANSVGGGAGNATKVPVVGRTPRRMK